MRLKILCLENHLCEAIYCYAMGCLFFFFQAEDGIRDLIVTGVQTCALPISPRHAWRASLCAACRAQPSHARCRSVSVGPTWCLLLCCRPWRKPDGRRRLLSPDRKSVV